MQDATVQSIPQTSPTAVSSQSQYVPAAPVAQPNYQFSSPASYQVAQAPSPYLVQTAPQSAPSPYAPQPSASNPWESAFNKVVGLLSAPVQSPFQGQLSTTVPTPAQYSPYSNPAQLISPNWGAQTSPASQTYSHSSSQTSSAPSLSLETKQVVQAYGPEAPGLLNQYALQLENVLDSAISWGKEAQELLSTYRDFAYNEHNELNYACDLLEKGTFVINEQENEIAQLQAAAEHLYIQNNAYNQILTNPDILSDYTLKFFGPEGPYPVYESEAELGLNSASYGMDTSFSGQQFIQPMPGTPEPAAPVQQGDFWGAFQAQMDADPANAWRLLNMASPQVVQQKLLVRDSY